MLIGYARTSTVEQVAGYEAQKAELAAAGCDLSRIYEEHASGVDAQRRELVRLLGYIRPGDTVVVTKLDRLARSVTDLLAIVAKIEAAGATLRILAMQLDTGTATGKFMLTVLGSVAAFERDMMLERQKAGIAKAKADGKYKGRAPTAKAKAGEAIKLLEGGVKPAEVARRVGIARSSLYRIMEERGVKRSVVVEVDGA